MGRRRARTAKRLPGPNPPTDREALKPDVFGCIVDKTGGPSLSGDSKFHTGLIFWRGLMC